MYTLIYEIFHRLMHLVCHLKQYIFFGHFFCHAQLGSNCAHIVGGSDPPKMFYNTLYDLMEPKLIVQLLHMASIR